MVGVFRISGFNTRFNVSSKGPLSKSNVKTTFLTPCIPMHHIAALHILIDLKCKGYFSSASKHVLLNYSLIILLIYYFAHIKLFSHYYVSIIFKLLIVKSWYPTRRKVDWCRYHFTLANARQFYSSRREHLITNELNEGCFPSFNLVIRISLVRKVNPIWQCSFRRWLIMITIG